VSPPPPLIIVNNTAARARQAWPLIRRQLEREGIAFEFHETSHAGDATLQTRAALKAGCQTIVAVGGDGTLSEAAAGFFEFSEDENELPKLIAPNAALAVLPAGTGDDFARGLKGRRASLTEWIDVLLAHLRSGNSQCIRTVDVICGRSHGHPQFICLNASTIGIGGEVAHRVAGQGAFVRRLSGEIRFLFAAVGALFQWRERPVRVHVDESDPIEAPMNLVAVANNAYAGGGMMLSPNARIDDGKIDVLTVSGLSRLEVVRELPRLHSGGHLRNPKVRVSVGTRVLIETFSAGDAMSIEVDGNLCGTTPAEFQIMPGVLRFVV
jgi:diacylglycerol kinase (ATP)